MARSEKVALTKNLLDLTGKELDAEMERIIRDNPPSKKRWTQKEIEVARRLAEAGVPRRIIAERLGRSTNSVNAFLDHSSLQGS